MNKFQCLDLAHIHIIVDDLDYAAEFYRDVMGFIEMQSHNNLINRGLSTYYGFEEIWDRLEVSLRFLAFPNVLTIKLVKISVKGYGGRSGSLPSDQGMARIYSSGGAGPVSVVVDDLDAAYEYYSAYASDYSARFRISLLSPPVFLSPLLPHQTGATQHSALYGNKVVLDDLAKRFPERAKFQMIDPFGMRWEFNNPVDELPGRVAS
ncbi:VOC family protein [Rhizobium leguminosarum]|uniref:VOC family protein n=1 Tax=Rhizobium leguminosarum TaxID=384 RepID=UPI003F9DDBB1